MITTVASFVFHADNVHVGECGPPPNVVNDQANTYHGYFENEHGEQWVLIVDRATKRGILRGGDSGWDEEYEITDGRPSDLVLSPSEQAWLKSCWHAATGTEA